MIRQQQNFKMDATLHKRTWLGCGFAAATQQNLDTHYRKHTGERPYKCTWAGCSMPHRGSRT